ncbi:MAG: glycosyltransferase family 4 protein [Candidatus Thorarchaeota archaeon]
MKILIICRMSNDIEASFSHVWGNLKSVSSVTVVRGKTGLFHPKVHYVTFHYIVDKIPLLRSLLQLIYSFFLCISYNPDIICSVHMSPQGYYGYALSKIFRKPLVLHLVSESYGGLLLRKYASKQANLMERPFAYRSAMHADIITTTGESSKKRLANVGIPSDRIYASPSVISTSRYKYLNLPKTIDIITLTRLSWEKHLDVFLQVIKEISERRPIRAVIAGIGPEMANLKAMAKQLDITDQVEFLGWVPDENLIHLLNSSSIFLLTSSTEGFPTTIAEAVCNGVNVISSDVGDISSFIKHGSNGFLVRPFNNVQKYVENALLLLDNPDYSMEIRKNGLETCKCLLYSQRESVFQSILHQLIAQAIKKFPRARH